MPRTKSQPAENPSLFVGNGNGAAVGRLSEIEPHQQADCFALLAARERATTRDGKPYYRCTFRDADRSATAMIWADSALFGDCDQSWQAGQFFKLRCRYSESNYGPQIDIDRIRPATDEDRADGFDPGAFYARSRFDADEMFSELTYLIEAEIEDVAVRQLVAEILVEHAEAIKTIPAAKHNHHAYRAGFLEHVLSVTRLAVHLADKYRAYYSKMQPPLNKSLVVAGAVLHDIGKLTELDAQPHGAEYTAHGKLVGHILLGRDIVRDKAREMGDIDPETLLRLEHIIIAHQNLPEWGSPIAPHTPEALLVHYADDLDAKFHMFAVPLEEERVDGQEFTERTGAMRRQIFRGLETS